MKLIALIAIIVSTLTLSGVSQAKAEEKANYKEKIFKKRIMVVKAAKKMLGVPYIFGGESKRGLDCSGLTRIVYKAVNILLPHFAASQMHLGKWVRQKFLRPGDLLFYYDGGHVALYIGNGKMIHASSSYGRVVNAPLRTGWTQARRIIHY